MSATTIKIEDPLYREILRLVPPKKSLTAYVKEVLESEVRRQRMIQAAEKYVEFLESHPDERTWIEDWESADLGQPPRSRRARKGKS